VLAAGSLSPVQTRSLASLFGAGPVTAYALDELTDAVVGLHDADGETLGLGVVRSITTSPPALEIVSPVEATPASVTIGRTRWRGV
jgi:polynucleotide 5'-kinase involved in rRNA processing